MTENIREVSGYNFSPWEEQARGLAHVGYIQKDTISLFLLKVIKFRSKNKIQRYLHVENSDLVLRLGNMEEDERAAKLRSFTLPDNKRTITELKTELEYLGVSNQIKIP